MSAPEKDEARLVAPIGLQEQNESAASLDKSRSINTKPIGSLLQVVAPELLAQALQPIVSRVRTEDSAVKINGRSSWTKDPLTHERMLAHVNGGAARGVCPMKRGETTTRVALFDLDSHKGETDWPEMQRIAGTLCQTLDLFGFSPIAFRSSGGHGIHVYVLWDNPQDAYSVRETMRDMLTSIGYVDGAGGVAKRQIEVFPKQNEIGADRHGNQFFLPLTGHSVPLNEKLEPMARGAVVGISWPTSGDVMQHTLPPISATTYGEPDEVDKVRRAVDAIPNDGSHPEMEYGWWHGMVCAIHEALGGGQDAFDMAVRFSERNPVFTRPFFERRVWPYVKPRDGGRTRASLYAEADRWSTTWRQAATSADGFDDEQATLAPPTSIHAFESILSYGKYMFKATNEMWPASSVNQSVRPWPTGPKKAKRKDEKTGEVTVVWEEGDIPPSQWLDKNRPIQQIGWLPGQPPIVENKVLQESGVCDAPGHRLYNLYKPPPALDGDASQAGPWIDLVRSVYPDHADHLIRWFAHYAQRPHLKVNHGLVLGGSPGIGKDTLLEPIKQGCVGAWNWADISPAAFQGRFNGWARNIIVRVSEMRDTDNRFLLYESSKTYLAAPPDSIRVDEKNLREHYVVNVMGVIFTTNNRTDGLYLPADDRRHYVAWSERVKESFTEGYWKSLYQWYESGGIGHVAAYLRSVDLTDFDPKAPPPLTRDFWLIVQSGEPPENAEFRDLVDGLEHKDAFTISDLVDVANRIGVDTGELRERRSRRAIGHKFAAIGYGAVRNPDAKEGQWLVRGRRQTIYSRLDLPLPDQIRLCRDLQKRSAADVDEAKNLFPDQ